MEYYIDGECKYSVKECKERDATYTMPLRVKARLTSKETGKMIEQIVFMGTSGMTENGTFIINGTEKELSSRPAGIGGRIHRKGVSDSPDAPATTLRSSPPEAPGSSSSRIRGHPLLYA